jgi:hypothetical protein
MADEAADKPAVESPPGPLAAGAERIRDSAKWLIAAFAAVGAVLAAGLQLTGLGGLEGGRLLATLIGLGLAVAGVVVAITASGSVVTASFVSLKWLSEQASSNTAMVDVEGDTGLLGGFATVKDLKDAYDAAVAARKEALEAHYGDPADDAKKLKAQTTQAWVQALDQSQVHVIERAGFNKLRSAYREAGRWIAVGAVLAAVGIATFAWGANPPSSESAPIVVPAPTDVTVQINKAQRPALQSRLGADCDLSNLEGVAVGVVGESYQVATVATTDCTASLITVTPDIGRVSVASDAATSIVGPTPPGSGHGS